MHKIADHLTKVRQRIAHACQNCQRSTDDVLLLAVSKTKPSDAIRNAHSNGQNDFGENYLQEALDKQEQLSDLSLNWHFIGPIQSNKTRSISSHFDWVHSVDRLKIAQRLNDQRPDSLPKLNICLQVNLDDEASKSGFVLADLESAAEQITQLPRLELRGLMAIPAKCNGFSAQLKSLQRLQQAFTQLNQKGYKLDTLSMGMSNDLEAAIAAGSTMVRVGTDIFGAREPNTNPKTTD